MIMKLYGFISFELCHQTWIYYKKSTKWNYLGNITTPRLWKWQISWVILFLNLFHQQQVKKRFSCFYSWAHYCCIRSILWIGYENCNPTNAKISHTQCSTTWINQSTLNWKNVTSNTTLQQSIFVAFCLIFMKLTHYYHSNYMSILNGMKGSQFGQYDHLSEMSTNFSLGVLWMVEYFQYPVIWDLFVHSLLVVIMLDFSFADLFDESLILYHLLLKQNSVGILVDGSWKYWKTKVTKILLREEF